MTVNKFNVNDKLEDLHKDAQKDFLRVGKGIVKSIFRSVQPADFENAYLPISKSQGTYLRQLIVDNDCKHVVEFGTSFGISTIYLADGVRKTGGKVISTELLESKAAIALKNISEVQLEGHVEIRVGDAMETLGNYEATIDFLFLDGWKDLYLPLFQQLESNFKSGTLIYADNVDMQGTEDYTQYVFSNNKKYNSKLMHDAKGLLTTVK